MQAITKTTTASIRCLMLPGNIRAVNCTNIQRRAYWLPKKTAKLAFASEKLPAWKPGVPLGYEGIYLYEEGSEKRRSFWHDVPLRVDGSYSFVSEIPKDTTAKMEIDKDLPYNPIVQDLTKTGALRYYAEAIPWNYGCIPQTFEDPARRDTYTALLGDGDPIDVVEIGTASCETGSISRIKILGSLALIDEGETDWKIIAINVEDPLAKSINSVKDIPQIVDQIRTWFRDYKIPDGKKPNTFALNGVPLDVKETDRVIQETHGDWLKLIASSTRI